jgi:hypothetical protein
MTPQEQQKRYDFIEHARMDLDASLAQLKQLEIIMERNGTPDEVSTLIGDSSCITVRHGNVITGIEKDGYAHQ